MKGRGEDEKERRAGKGRLETEEKRGAEGMKEYRRGSCENGEKERRVKGRRRREKERYFSLPVCLGVSNLCHNLIIPFISLQSLVLPFLLNYIALSGFCCIPQFL